MKDYSKYSTEVLYCKLHELMEIISICEDYLSRAHGTFLGPLGAKAEIKKSERDIRKIEAELTKRGK